MNFHKPFSGPRITLICLFLSCVLVSHRTDEGMFPLSQLKDVDFKAAGFHITQKDIFNPDGIALTDALVRLGGCTGSFVSDQGLIVTNHHCVFGSVSNISTDANNYLENGFYASDKSKEIKIGLTCKITKSYEDVSLRVLDGITMHMDPAMKREIINRNSAVILEQEKAKYPDLTVEISEMFVGYSYTLFRYQTLRDVRLVYVPPRTIGEFGGETDNWEWPKHAGDFSFVRAYVGKDGKPADYSPDNIPFTPKKHLVINPRGTRENDLVFILGYPGTTFRHEPYQFIQYQEQYVLPFISEWFGWRISKMEELGKNDVNRSLRLAGTIKGLANVKKNYEGKVFGLKQTGLLETKKAEQEALKNAMIAAGDRNIGFFNAIDSLYQVKLSTAQRDLLFNRFNGDCGAFAAALLVSASTKEKAPARSDSAFWKKWKSDLKEKLKISYRIVDIDLDRATLAELIRRANQLEKKYRVKALKKIKDPVKWSDKAYASSFLDEPKLFYKLLDSVPWVVYENHDALQKLADKLLPTLQEVSQSQVWVNNQLNQQLPLLLEARIRYGNKKFIPDANATLRFTYGYISGYKQGLNPHPAPYTYRKEIFEKNGTDNQDYRLSTSVMELLRQQTIAAELLDPATNDLVICMLYNMDTTQGNSGSPVMDANGQLVGVNFDRAYTATLNDYSWNADYSRSIAVDIRYVLFTMKYLNHADNLLSEMGVNIP